MPRPPKRSSSRRMIAISATIFGVLKGLPAVNVLQQKRFGYRRHRSKSNQRHQESVQGVHKATVTAHPCAANIQASSKSDGGVSFGLGRSDFEWVYALVFGARVVAEWTEIGP